ncbi:hypothetical protein [Flavobacterium anhuiense]|uniref:hypothetical protein n=1 Tax=Flavobacterium anhuiense TaxID=459526 RepID=UPI0034D97714
MKIEKRKELVMNEIEGELFDLFIFANNIEKRKLTAYENLKQKNKVSKVIAFSYPESDIEEISFAENYCIKEHDEILAIIDLFILNFGKDSINICIDYSCMTKSWYYSILLYFTNKKIELDKVKILFIYTPSVYSKPLKPKPNTDIQPLPGKYIIPNNKPKALVVCLGYEQNKAQGIIDQLDPKITYVFYSKPSLDDKFVEKIEKNNKSVIDENKNIITFPIDSLLFIENELVSLYHLLKEEYNIIIAPLGPKPFTFVAMVLSVVYPDIDIWRVGSGFDINEYEREPLVPNKFIISELLFSN